MALITCKECGGTVSDTAASCPHCGYNMKLQNAQTNQREVSKDWIPVVAFLGVTILFIAIVAIIISSGLKHQKDSYNKGVQNALTVEDGKPLEEYMEETEEKIKDLEK